MIFQIIENGIKLPNNYSKDLTNNIVEHLNNVDNDGTITMILVNISKLYI